MWAALLLTASAKFLQLPIILLVVLLRKFSALSSGQYVEF